MRRDPATAAYAWSRYRQIMRWLMAAMIALMVVVVRLVSQHAGGASVRRYVLAAVAVGVAMLVGSLLMGLVALFNTRAAGGNPPPEPRRSDAPE